MNNQDKIKLLSSPEAQQFLAENQSTPLPKIAFAYKDSHIPLQLLLEQLESAGKAKEKLPAWNVPGVLFPPRVNLEQTSSEETAKFKAGLLAKGKKHVVDLTGGFGVDSFFFSREAGKVTMVEPDPWLCELARHNFQLLGAKNITVINSTAEEARIPQDADLIYMDPSRRSNTGKKVFSLADYSPDPTTIKQQLPGLPLVIKTSPMADIDNSAQAIGNVKEVHIVSRKDQVREILFYSVPAFNKEPQIFVHELGYDFTFSFLKSEETGAQLLTTDPQAGGFLHAPYSCLMKAGCFKLLAEKTGTSQIHPDTHLYFSPEKVTFPGNTFRILKKISPSLKDVKKEIQSKDWVPVSRNFPTKSEEIKRKLRLTSSDKNFIWFVKTGSGFEALICEKVPV